MQKGLEGYGAFDTVNVPIINNTAHECDLADSLGEAIRNNPRSYAVLVRNHGMYVWGKDWKQAKTRLLRSTHHLGIMRDQQQRVFAIGAHPAEQFQHGRSVFRIKTAGGFVRQYQRRRVHHRARNGHALLFTHRQRPRLVVKTVFESDALQQLDGPVRPAVAAARHLPQQYVFQSREPLEQVEGLEHVPDVGGANRSRPLH